MRRRLISESIQRPRCTSSMASHVAHPVPTKQPPTPLLTHQHRTHMNVNRVQVFKRSRNSAFKEFQEMKQTWVQAMQQAQAMQQSILALLPGFPTAQPVVSLSGPLTPQAAARKRPAPVPPQPECPVALRPNHCQFPSTLLPWQQWSVPSLRAPSPSVPVPVSEPVPPATTEQPMIEQKWSNPSSVDSNGQKTDSTTGESTNIDIVGMDGSESSTSSTSTQAMVTSPERPQFTAFIKEQQQHPPLPPYYMKTEILPPCYPNFKIAKTELGVPIPAPQAMNGGPPERKHRKQQNDDYVRIIRQQDLSEARIEKILIPVPEALDCDPNFRPVSEQQIIQQVIQHKKFEETTIKDSMILLCKKLAEKRVFGCKLMSTTTVAGLNHSNYNNLPIEGVIYIMHVCRKVMGDKFAREEDFWEAFREATRKLAARCRRVRHASKTKGKCEEGEALLAGTRGDEKPECSVASTLLSLNMPPIQEKNLLPLERSAAETLQSLSRPDTAANNIHAMQATQMLQGLLPENTTWSSLLSMPSSLPGVKREFDADIQPISP